MSRISLTVSLLMLLLFSCEDGYLTDCSECNPDRQQTKALMRVLVGPIPVNINQIVTIYEGAIEDSIIIVRYSYGDLYLDRRVAVVLYKDYTATSEFTYNGKKYILTAAASPKLRYDENTCDNPCYYVYDNVLDLRLRYD